MSVLDENEIDYNSKAKKADLEALLPKDGKPEKKGKNPYKKYIGKENNDMEEAIKFLNRLDDQRRKWARNLYGIDNWDPPLSFRSPRVCGKAKKKMCDKK